MYDTVPARALFTASSLPRVLEREVGYEGVGLDILLTCVALPVQIRIYVDWVPVVQFIVLAIITTPPNFMWYVYLHHPLTRQLEKHHTHLNPGKNTSSKPTHPQPPRTPPKRTSPPQPRASASATP